MPRTCSICQHPDREAIDRAIAAGESFRGIARNNAVSEDAIARHQVRHMPQVLAQARACRADASAAAVGKEIAQQEAHALDVMEELTRLFRRMNMLMDSCHAWLQDPDDPERYYLGPRADDVVVVYMGRDSAGKSVPKKAPLTEILARVEGAGVRVVRWETKYADPRELAVKVAGQLKGQVELLAKLMGELAQEGAVNIVMTPEWAVVRATLIGALQPFPEARLAVAERLSALDSA